MHPNWFGHIKIKEPKELKDAVKDYLKICKGMINWIWLFLFSLRF